MRQFAPPVPDQARWADLLFFGHNRYQLPMPTTVAADSKEWNDVDEFALARGASARCIARHTMPVVDVYTGGLEEVELARAIGARVLLYEAAQEELALLLDRREILTLACQEFGILHRVSPRRAAESLSQPPTRRGTGTALSLSERLWS
jgi:hypothetical protein